MNIMQNHKVRSRWPHDDAWEEEIDTEEGGDEGTTIEPSRKDVSLETDNLVLQYFGDIRRFTLLSQAEEQTLWRRIERERERVRRALYTSPVALQTLTRMWGQVQNDGLPLQHIVETDIHAPTNPNTQHLEHSILRLQALALCLWPLKKCPRAAPRSAAKRRAWRQERVRLWQEWIALWEGLQLNTSVHEALQFALDVAYQARPHDPGLHVAHRAWGRAQRELYQAKTQMLRANLRLVVYVAKRYRHRGVPFLDLIQEGNIGLMRALDKFDFHRGLKFVTYAHWWVRQAISRAIVEQHSTVRLPGYMVDRSTKLQNVGAKLGQLFGRTPNVQELSTALGWAPHEVEALQGVKPTIVRLHESVKEDGRRLEESIEDEGVPHPDRLVASTELRQCVVASLADLPERDARLLRLRFGLDTDRPHSLREIGTLFGVSRERIRQLEKIALERLRHSTRGAVLADFAGVLD